jgi:phospholipid/cholesterol/gamma-HCH transport system substrate-binding protein
MVRFTTRRTPIRWAATGLVLLGVAVLTGCQGAYDLPLPSSGAMDGKGYQVTVQFADVLDLVPQWTAKVTLHVDDSVHLPANATATLEQTSLLGEKYVELAAPTATPPEGQLHGGAVIPLARTTKDPQVEDVLGALSLLLNGGGVAQLKVITAELNQATHGNEASIRDLVGQLDTFVGGLDAQKSQIVKALDAVDKLSGRLDAQKADLATALDHLPAGLRLLADQRAQLTAMLSSLDRLGVVGSRVITASKDNTVADLLALQPTLTQLTRSGDDLPNSLRLLLSFPFPDDAAQGAIKGDYANLHATLDLNVAELLQQNAAGLKAEGLSGLPSLPTLPSQPALPSLPGLCIPLVPCGSSGGTGDPAAGPRVPDAASLLKSLQDAAPSLLGTGAPPAGQSQLLSLLLGGLSK